MPTAFVIGAGVAGLGTSLALGRDGWDVRVVERDATTVPDSPDAAFREWDRRGAPQVHHSHAFLARLRNLLRERAPDVLAALLDAGATEFRFADNLPPEMTGFVAERADDELVAISCRRTTFEWVLRRCALASERVSLVEGTVERVLQGGAPGGVPHVHGIAIRHASGEIEDRRADIVIDASGPRSPLPRWLTAAGCTPIAEEVEDTGIIYVSRFYRLLAGAEPPPQQGPIGGDLGYMKYAVFTGDNRTFSITFALPVDDPEFRRLLHPEPFEVAAAALPATRAWIEPDRAEPITRVEVMARLMNRRRELIGPDGPVVTGVFAVGDANICTNPLYGRGCSLAMVHAYGLADAVRDHADDPVGAAVAFDAFTRAELLPWYSSAVMQDRANRASARAAIDGRADESPDGTITMASLLRDGVLPATRTDPKVWRAFVRVFNLLVPPEQLMADGEVIASVMAAYGERHARPDPEPLGPGRAQMLAILDAAA